MIRVLFLKEIREAFTSRRFWIVLALCLVLIPLGVQVSLKDYQTRLQNYREAVRIYQEETKTASDILYREGGKAFAPPSPLNFLSLGLALVNPNIAETQYRNGEPPAVMRLSNNQGLDNLYEYFYGALDLVFIVAVVMSLLAVSLTFGAIAGEKENGTLKQILSYAVPRPQIVLAKALANGLVLVVPFLLSLGLSLAILGAGGGASAAAPGAGVSIGLAILASVLLIGVFLNLSLLVSTLTKQAVQALVVLLLAWVFLYGIYPRLSAAAAQIISPVKSEARVALDKAQLRRAVNKERDAEIDALVQASPDKMTQTDMDDMGKKQEAILDRYQGKLEESWKSLEADVAERQRVRGALAADIARLSPVSAFVRPLAELSRNGTLEYRQFDTGIRRFEETLNREIFNKNKFIRMKGGAAQLGGMDLGVAAPVFTYTPAATDAMVRNVLPDLVILVLFNVLFFAGAFVAFLRYDPR